MDNNELNSRMDRIIEWVKTCDTKASIMLTLICLIVSFIFTSDFVLNGMTSVIRSFRVYKDSGSPFDFSDISWSGTFAVISMIVFLYFSFGSIYRLIMVLYSKISEKMIASDLKKTVYRFCNALFRYMPSVEISSDVQTDSLIHFNHIAEISDYDTFKKAIQDTNYVEQADLLSQIYINAKRCKEKYDDYNSAIRWLLYSMPFVIFLFLSISVFMTYHK